MLLEATTVRLLPEEIDLSFVLTTSGLGALACTTVGALRGYQPERLRRLALLGTVVGGTFGVVCILLVLTRAIR